MESSGQRQCDGSSDTQGRSGLEQGFLCEGVHRQHTHALTLARHDREAVVLG